MTEANPGGGRQIRVDLQTFQWLGMKTKAKQSQVHLVDVSEAVYGASAPFDKLPRRIWEMVDEVIDEYLAADGYCTRTDGNRLWLLLPKLAPGLGKMKAKLIADEIRRQALKLLPPPEEPPQAAAQVQKPAKKKAAAPVALDPKQAKEQEELRKQSNLVIEGMTARLTAIKLTPADLEMPPGYSVHFVPAWNIDNNMVIGYSAEPSKDIGDGDNGIRAPVSHEEQEKLDLPIFAAAINLMNQIVEAEKQLTVTVPVQWITLDSLTSRTKFLELAREIRDEGRKLMILSVEAIPEDLLPGRIEDRLREFSRFFRLFSLSLRLGRRDFSQLKGLSLVKMYSVDLGKEIWDEKMHLVELNRLIDAITPFRKPLRVSNVSTRSQLVAALSAGARRISGSVIPNDGKFEIRHLTLTDLYVGQPRRQHAPSKGKRALGDG